MKNINDEKYGRLTVLLLIAWLALSITASAWSLFHAGSKHAAHPPLPLGLAVIMPVLLFALWFAASPEFRRFALSLNVRTLTIVQSWRIGGFVFLILYTVASYPRCLRCRQAGETLPSARQHHSLHSTSRGRPVVRRALLPGSFSASLT